jgi:hypothetical protein
LSLSLESSSLLISSSSSLSEFDMVGTKCEDDLGGKNCATVLGKFLGIMESLGRDCDGFGLWGGDEYGVEVFEAFKRSAL